MHRNLFVVVFFVFVWTNVLYAQEDNNNTSESVFDSSLIAPSYRMELILGNFDSLTNLFLDKVLRDELELVDEQINELDLIQRQFSETVRVVLSAKAKGEKTIEGKTLAAAIQTAYDKRQEKMNEILLPHQRVRFAQLGLQAKIKDGGEVAAFADKTLVSALELTEEQLNRINVRAEEIKQELEKDIETAKEDARQKLLNELTPKQQKLFEEMVGAKPKTRTDSEK